jgi:hypothetical protein
LVVCYSWSLLHVAEACAREDPILFESGLQPIAIKQLILPPDCPQKDHDECDPWAACAKIVVSSAVALQKIAKSIRV